MARFTQASSVKSEEEERDSQRSDNEEGESQRSDNEEEESQRSDSEERDNTINHFCYNCRASKYCLEFF